jgi:hypothetical protein
VLSTNYGAYALRADDAASMANITIPIALLGISLSSTSQAAGVDNYLFGGGFLSGERLSVHTVPAGALDDLTGYADTIGSFNYWLFRTRAAAASGRYTLTVTGETSRRTAQATLGLSGGQALSVLPASSPRPTRAVASAPSSRSRGQSPSAGTSSPADALAA